MREWTPNDWTLFFGAISANAILIIHALASWAGRKENRQQNQRIEKEVAEVKGTIAAATGTGDGEPC